MTVPDAFSKSTLTTPLVLPLHVGSVSESMIIDKSPDPEQLAIETVPLFNMASRTLLLPSIISIGVASATKLIAELELAPHSSTASKHIWNIDVPLATV